MNDSELKQLLERVTAPPLSEESEMRLELAVFRAAAARDITSQRRKHRGVGRQRALIAATVALAFGSGWMIDRVFHKSNLRQSPQENLRTDDEVGDAAPAAVVDIDLWATETKANLRVRFDKWERFQ